MLPQNAVTKTFDYLYVSYFSCRHPPPPSLKIKKKERERKESIRLEQPFFEEAGTKGPQWQLCVLLVHGG